MESFLVLILMFGALYYLLLRPQQKREKARRELVRSLQAGDEVITNSGIHGVVAEVEDTVVWLEVAPDVELKMSRDSVAGKVPSSDDAEDDEADNDDEKEDTDDVAKRKKALQSAEAPDDSEDEDSADVAKSKQEGS